MPFNCIFCTRYNQYCSSANFITNPLRAPYKTYISCRVSFFSFFFLLTTFLTLNIGENKGTRTVPPIRYCFRCCFYRYFSLYFPSPYTDRINLAATAYINPIATCYGPPYHRVARLWSYYHPPYYGAARS